MLCCYQPDPPPQRADNPDRCDLSILLHRRYWLHVHWIGMQEKPAIDRAYVTDGVHQVPVSPDRLHVLSKPAFDVWYSMHWKQFMAGAALWQRRPRMTDPPDPLFAQFSREFRDLADDTTPVMLQLRKLDAWIILCQLQLALRHPENTGASAEAVRRIAKQLEAFVASEGALAEVCRRGWEGE